MEMDTQTHEYDENLLLLETSTENFLSDLIGGGDSDSEVERSLQQLLQVDVAEPSFAINPLKLEFVCSAETETRLTEFYVIGDSSQYTIASTAIITKCYISSFRKKLL